METQLLRTFVTVAERGSISAAASELGYVQSSVSEQVRRLERELGETLLTRTSTGVVPTSRGARLLPEARRVLRAVEELRRMTSCPQRLRVGAVDTLAIRWLPEVTASLPSEDRPVLTMDRRDRLLEALVDGRSDIAVLYRPSDTPLPHLGATRQSAAAHLQVDVLDSDRLLAVAAPGAVDTPAQPVGWLVTQPGCVHREAFDRHIAAHTPHPEIRAEAPTPDALRQLARQGVGRALLPALAVADDLADGTLQADPSAFEERIEIVAVHHRDASPDVRAFVDHAIAHSRRRVTLRPAA